MELLAGTQALFYHGIQDTKIVKPRRLTITALDMTHHAVKDLNGNTPINEKIWKSIRDPTISHSARGSLWKNMHGAYKIGEHWTSIPNYEHRANCGICGDTETMEHIHLRCDRSQAIKTIWKLTRKTWLKREENWPGINYGTILGCNLVHFKAQNGEPQHGKNRLFTILITEGAHLIWKIRCERAIQRLEDPEKHHTKEEIENKWLYAINRWPKFDRLITNIPIYGKKAIKEKKSLKHGV